jgi:aspartyl-tRNA(Asn)/glutamyl-tRNA(Gln) amidotransferase subunit B
VNSFRFLERAIEYEIRRQIELIEDGGTVVQETRLYDADRDETRSMRSKEDAMDYRYFPDPDLLPLAISVEWIERVRAGMPELPEAKRARFLSQYGLSEYDAATLTASKAMADFYESTVAKLSSESKLAANWLAGDVSAALNRAEIGIEASPITATQLAGLLRRIADGTLSGKMAKEVFEAMWNGEDEASRDADVIIEKRGLKQLSDTGAIEQIVDQVLAANPKSVEEFRSGKEKAFNALVGQVMKASQGKANPAQVNEVLKRKLGGA